MDLAGFFRTLPGSGGRKWMRHFRQYKISEGGRICERR
jgi:hypothetical protein